MTHYIAIIHKDADSDFGVSFPDFPGCVTAGSTLDEARAMAEEALAFHLEGMVEDGETIPASSNLETIMTSADFRDGVAVLVATPARAPKAVRVNVSIPEDVLQAIDATARRTGATRSGFLTQAAREAIHNAA